MDFRKEQAVVTLNGEWRFAFAEAPLPLPLNDIRDEAGLLSSGLIAYPTTVPGNFELDLLANGLIEDPFVGMNAADLRDWENKHLWYSHRFTAPPQPDDQDALLVFEGLDCFADIFLNGERHGSTDNMLIEHVFPVDRAVLRRGKNDVLVHIRPVSEEARRHKYPPSLFAAPNLYESLYVRKAPHMYGWDIMPRIVSAGIWRPVKLLYVPKERFRTVFLETLSISISRAQARLALHFDVKLSGVSDMEIEVEGKIDGETAFRKREPLLFSAGRIGFTVDNPRLWWPRGRGESALYDVRVSLLYGSYVLDTVTFTHGVRTVELILPQFFGQGVKQLSAAVVDVDIVDVAARRLRG